MIKFSTLTGLCLFVQFLHAQSLHNLDQNLAFNAVLHKYITYPQQAAEAKVYTRSTIYAHFQIDSLGRVGNIAILNPGQPDYGFDNQVIKALHHLPHLKPAYTGEYILPVRFVFAYTKGDIKLDTLVPSILTDEALKIAYPYMILLSERKIEAYIPMFIGNRK
ncbi:energy transducer TonB [Dyadobacter sp. CY356]|uniref:energy transducer TonB n=1 Tax=Dyadobacter sp. CY356 TaxID=2906442 RepID=UPI001F3203C4|nr:energy transducer TonB [Dyadobacter sp. CY356]MCF0054331.1 energy transducer TonB [Dyadobacter sp. CY356]